MTRTTIAILAVLSVSETVYANVRLNDSGAGPPHSTAQAAENRKSQDQEFLSVRVMDLTDRPIWGATVIACIRSDKPTSLETHEAKTDVTGTAGLVVHGRKCRVLAFTKDGSLAGQASVRGDERRTTIKLTPSAVLRGRLLTDTSWSTFSANSLSPAAGRRVLCYLTDEGNLETVVPLETKTNASGAFKFAGVPAKARCRLVLVKDARDGSVREGVSFAVRGGRSLDLGDVYQSEFLTTWIPGAKDRNANWLPNISPGDVAQWDARHALDAEFVKALALGRNPSVRHFSAPFPEIRERWAKLYFSWLNVTWPQSQNKQHAFVLLVSNGRLLAADGFKMPSRDLRDVVERACGLRPEDVDGRGDHLAATVSGDIVVRAGTPLENRVRELEQILRKECDVRVRLKLENEPRKVFVAEGQIQLKPLAGQQNAIAIYGSDDPGDPKTVRVEATARIDYVLNHTSVHIARRIINRVSTPPDPQFTYRVYGYTPQPNPELVLRHLSEQTGLRFREETRMMPVLHVE
jgi:hypothetical protein